jgi:hypothetical protein
MATGLWACAVDLSIEKRDGWEDPSDDDPVEEETGDVEPDVEPDLPDEPDAEEPACEGLAMWGVCWYLSEGRQTCTQACETHGGISDQAPEYVGSSAQGGSSEECETLLTALGHEGTPTSGSPISDRGAGCHLWSDGAVYWVEDIDLDPEISHPNAFLVCGCNE